MPRRYLALAALALAFAGCGYFRSGTWDDDPDNLGRAFGTVPGPGIEVIHSRYTRFPHFTLEFVYWFQLRLGPDHLARLTEHLARVDEAGAAEARAGVLAPEPAWFAPRAAGAYEAWVLQEAPSTSFVVFRDRATGDVFVHASQL
jgi:hypothetical protein